MPLMEHPDLPGQIYDAPESAVPHHRESGWRLVGEQVAEPVPADAETPTSGEDDKPDKKSPRGRRTTEGND